MVRSLSDHRAASRGALREREDLQIAKLNVDENPQTAAQYNVMSIPMLLLFKGGQPVHQIIGALPKSRLVQEIEPALAA